MTSTNKIIADSAKPFNFLAGVLCRSYVVCMQERANAL